MSSIDVSKDTWTRRAEIRDPDGHLIEVGQSTRASGASS
jgi:hypothetical protein